jgi:group I intron endonuclease
MELDFSAQIDRSYCVYFYLREDKTPYYIGMGKRERPFAKHLHREGRGDFKPKNRDLILIVHENLSQREAFDLEVFYIKFYGKKCDGGILINLTDGGEGARHNEETRKKISLMQLGRKASDETKRKMSESRRGRKNSPESMQKAWRTRIENGNNKHSEETKRKLSENHKGLFVGSKSPSARAVLAYDKNKNFIGRFETAREASEKLNLGDCWKHIPAVCKGKRKHTRGFVFKYCQEITEEGEESC